MITLIKSNLPHKQYTSKLHHYNQDGCSINNIPELRRYFQSVKSKSLMISLILVCTENFSFWQHDTHWATDTLTPGQPLWVTQSDIHTMLRLSRGLRGREQPRAAKFHTRQKSGKNIFKTHLKHKNCFRAVHSVIIHFNFSSWLNCLRVLFFLTTRINPTRSTSNSVQL